jgi:hypothetical protein
VQHATALDFLSHCSVFDNDAAIGRVSIGAARAVAAVNQKAAAVGASLAADWAESIAVLHVVEHDFLRKLPGSSGARAAVLAALRGGVIATLAEMEV